MARSKARVRSKHDKPSYEAQLFQKYADNYIEGVFDQALLEEMKKTFSIFDNIQIFGNEGGEHFVITTSSYGGLKRIVAGKKEDVFELLESEA